MDTPKMASAGKPVIANMEQVLSNKSVEPAVIEGEAKAPETPANTSVEENKGAEGTEQVSTEQPKEVNQISDDEIKRLYEERFKTDSGKESENREETDDEKAKIETEFEKKMLNLYVDGGGKIDDFLTIKQVAQMDLTALSKNELTNELKQAGFSDDEIQEIQVESYYQMNPDEIEQGFEESDEDFEKRKEKIRKKVAYGTEKLSKRSAAQQQQAKSILDTLRKAVEQQDLQAVSEREYAAKVEKLSKELPRKLTLQLGKVDDKEIAPIEFDVSEDDIASVLDTIKDQAKIETIFYQEDGRLNIEKVSEILLRNTILEKAAREALFEGQTRQVKIFEETFPARTAHEIGVGGTSSPSNNGQKGKLAGFGKPFLAKSADTRRTIK